jgi:hypothetical protein
VPPPQHAIACRSKIGGNGILGLSPTKYAGIEDLNCTQFVRLHGDWCKHMPALLRLLGLSSNAVRAAAV